MITILQKGFHKINSPVVKGFITVFILLGVASWMFFFLFKDAKTYPYGDGPEYILMTAALCNHQSVNIKSSDARQVIQEIEKAGQIPNKLKFFKEIEHFTKQLENGSLQPAERKDQVPVGFIIAKNNKLYSIHFWLLSVLAMPARAILQLVNGDLTKTYLITNICFLFIALVLLLTEKRLIYWHRLILAFFLGFSPIAWYFVWPHAEVFAGVWTFMGLVYFFVDRKMLSVLILSLVATHYPPVSFLALFIIINILYAHWGKWHLKFFIVLFLAGIWVFLPVIYNLILFGKPSIIEAQGYLNTDLLSFHRIISFLFDPNQGAILAIPLFLILFAILLVTDLIKGRFWVGYFLASSVIIMSLFFMQMRNWNHGQAVVNRYVVWVASIIIVITCFRIFKIKKLTYGLSVFSLLVASQFLVISLQSCYTKVTWDSVEMTKLSRYILAHYPDLYNPDPQIFKRRIPRDAYGNTDSVVVFSNKKHQITKIMLRPKSYRQLIERGMDSEKLVKFMHNVRKYYDYWFYINKSDFAYLGYQQSKDTLNRDINRDNGYK